MTEKKEDSYLKAILDKFNKERYLSLHDYLSKPTSGTIRDKIVNMLRNDSNISFENTLKDFLGEHQITEKKKLIDIAYKSIVKYRAIQRLLLQESKNGNNNTNLLRLCGFLVELKKNETTKEEIKRFNDSILITNIESGDNTNISIRNKNFGVSIDKIKSGKDTNLDI